MRQEIIDLYDQFTHSVIDRRLFMARLTELAGGTAAATALIPLLMADKAKAASQDGYADDLNPYRFGTTLHEEWLRGWDAAYERAKVAA